jgi:hypothetical protein
VIKRLRRWWFLRTHDCGDWAEVRQVNFVNPDPNAIPNPLSIYGPLGSYEVMLWHCTVCDAYWGHYHDTYGGHGLDIWEAKSLWMQPIRQGETFYDHTRKEVRQKQEGERDEQGRAAYSGGGGCGHMGAE